MEVEVTRRGDPGPRQQTSTNKQTTRRWMGTRTEVGGWATHLLCLVGEGEGEERRHIGIPPRRPPRRRRPSIRGSESNPATSMPITAFSNHHRNDYYNNSSTHKQAATKFQCACLNQLRMTSTTNFGARCSPLPRKGLGHLRRRLPLRTPLGWGTLTPNLVRITFRRHLHS